MKVSELFRRLSYGQLSNLAIASDVPGTLATKEHERIIQYTNEALLRLFSRFNLREKDLIIEMVGHITNYHLRVQYAESTNDPDISHPYIKDLLGEPFTGDVLKILEVFLDGSHSTPLPLNDQGSVNSVFTPQPDTLQVPNPIEGMPLGVSYQARHPVLRDVKLHVEDDLLEQWIDIPFFLENALQNYIGSLVYSHMNGQENVAKSQEYLAAYEMVCLEVEAKDLVNQSTSNNHSKFKQRGFV